MYKRHPENPATLVCKWFINWFDKSLFTELSRVHDPIGQYAIFLFKYSQTCVKGKLSDSFTNYNYVGNTKVSVSIKKT